MLARLRHNTFISGDHQEDGINPAYPSQHILDKVDVAWHVNNTHAAAWGR